MKTKVGLVCLVVLGACHFPARKKPTANDFVCKMPANGPADAAARAALERGDYRVLMHFENGDTPHSKTIGVESADPSDNLGPLWDSYVSKGHECGIEISLSEGQVPDCCDMPAPLTNCGEKQYRYAAAYNREIVRSSQFEKMCGAYKADRDP